MYRGIAYHQSSDGVVRVLSGSEKTPFMTLCRSDPQHQITVTVEEDTDYAGLQQLLKKLVFRSQNVFYVMEIQGEGSRTQGGLCDPAKLSSAPTGASSVVKIAGE